MTATNGTVERRGERQLLADNVCICANLTDTTTDTKLPGSSVRPTVIVWSCESPAVTVSEFLGLLVRQGRILAIEILSIGKSPRRSRLAASTRVFRRSSLPTI